VNRSSLSLLVGEAFILVDGQSKGSHRRSIREISGVMQQIMFKFDTHNDEESKSEISLVFDSPKNTEKEQIKSDSYQKTDGEPSDEYQETDSEGDHSQMHSSSESD
jgi:hypothetical protein